MSDSYSLYEAKARFSEVIRKVREGRTVIVSYHGTPVAEIRPYSGEGEDLEARLDRMVADGTLLRSPSVEEALPRPVLDRPGALHRFLAERDG
ncbi:MAG: type II toxin-antitoxin system prevent-host-death family antitoxin [Gemmatimonadota bacterium]